MISLQIPFMILIAGGCIYWLLQLVCLGILTKRSVPALKGIEITDSIEWPKLTIVIPAHNEAHSIEKAVESRLDDDYPYLEFILIDDRSTDGTSEIIDKIAARDSRVTSIHIRELPEGWLGKVFAMQRGVSEATGDWFLFSDADVHVKRGTLKRAISYCETRNVDHLTILPEIWPRTFFVDLLFSIMVRHVYFKMRVWAIGRKRLSASGGIGAFNLVRRTAFERINGFYRLKLAILDDVALGKILKQSGARCAVLNGREYVGLYWYRSLREVALGIQRILFGYSAKFNFIRIVASCIFLLWAELFPFLLLIPVPFLFHPFIGLSFLLISLATSLSINHWLNRSALSAILFPIAMPIYIFLILISAVVDLRRGGIFWGNKFFPTEILNAANRRRR